MGLFVNTVPVCFSMENEKGKEKSLREMIERVEKEWKFSFENQGPTVDQIAKG